MARHTRHSRTRDALLPPEVGVFHHAPDHLAERDPQLLGRGPADEVPAVEDAVDGEVREQGEGERHRQRPVDLVGRLADAELVREPQLLVTQEGKARAQARLEGGLDPGRIDGDDRDPAVGDFGGSMELDQLRQLNLSLGSPGAAKEGKDQRLAPGDV